MKTPGCPRLVRAEPHVGCYQRVPPAFRDATALCGGVSRLLLFAQRVAAQFSNERELPPGKQTHGSLSRVHQCALAYLFTPSTDIYSCPLAMTDGAARTLLSAGNQASIDRAMPHLITRNPEDFWTAGQWMTELTGGSDVGLSETIAKRERETGEKGNGQTQRSTLSTQHSELETQDSSLITHHYS